MIFRRVLFFLVIAGFYSGRSSAADPPGRFTAQLAVESDALIRCAVRRPYGWAWDLKATPEPNGRSSPRVVSMQSLGTPAAGLILLWSGKLLNQPRYIEAATQAARGVTAAQMPVGRIRSFPVFGPAAGGREDLAAIADRTATCCALGLLLASIDGASPSTEPADPHAEAIHRSAARCARWLAKQQAPNGLWISTFPPGPTTRETIRLVRLDNADYRDSTFALLLSADLLQEDVLHRLSIRPLDGLLKLRLASDVHGPNLWCTACTADGADVPTGFPNGPDVLASRFVMQTLLGGYLVTGDASLIKALDQAFTTLGQVKRADGLYDRFLDPTAAADVARSLGEDAPTSHPFFAHPATQPTTRPSVLSTPLVSGGFGIPELLDAEAQLKSIGRDRYNALLRESFSLHQQIQASLCGLSDDAFTPNFPATAKGVPAFINAHTDLWQLADGPAPEDLAGRVQRLWVIFLRAKLERLSDLKN